MRKGYDSNAVQAASVQISEEKEYTSDFSLNSILLCQAQENGGESEEAVRATERLLELNKGLVKSIALRFTDRGIDLEDLLQIGTIGMLKAIRSFDTQRGTCFSTYAVPLIFGEIRRYIRDDGIIKVGRYYKRLGASLTACRSRILASEGREAHISELAELCGVDVTEAAIALDALTPPASLSDVAYGEDDGVELGDVIADTDSLAENERIIDRIALSQAISELPKDWQVIVTLRYFRGLTQQQTAAVLGLTQVKISREEKKILEELRRRMA